MPPEYEFAPMQGAVRVKYISRYRIVKLKLDAAK